MRRLLRHTFVHLGPMVLASAVTYGLMATRFAPAAAVVIQPAAPVAAAAVAPTPTLPPTPRPLPQGMPLETYRVVAISDGDSFVATGPAGTVGVRMVGIDAAELAEGNQLTQCSALEARQKVKNDLLGKQVELQADPTQADRDNLGRLLRYVWLAGGEYNYHLVNEGLVREYTYHSQAHLKQEPYRAAQKSAEQRKVGLWAPTTCNGDSVKADLMLEKRLFVKAAEGLSTPVTCAQLADYTRAQRYYEYLGGPYLDSQGLDPDRDGKACEPLM